MYSANKKVIFLFFYLAAIKISRSSLLYMCVCVCVCVCVFRQEQNKIMNLGVYVDFDQESIKRTLTYD